MPVSAEDDRMSSCTSIGNALSHAVGVLDRVHVSIVAFNHVDRSSHLLGKDMERGEMPRAARWPLSITLALFVALLGVAGLWSQFTSR
jgi:hypothetical protein